MNKNELYQLYTTGIVKSEHLDHLYDMSPSYYQAFAQYVMKICENRTHRVYRLEETSDGVTSGVICKICGYEMFLRFGNVERFDLRQDYEGDMTDIWEYFEILNTRVNTEKYGFNYEGVRIIDPTMDETGRFPVDPYTYYTINQVSDLCAQIYADIEEEME